jgi:DNA-binding CsgD family transcriptional regulator/PAS domain-containing protein
MTLHERTLSLIRGIYAAAADEAQWPRVLEDLADAYGGGVAGFNYRIGPTGLVRAAQLARVDPAIIEAIQTHYAARNPWTRLTQPLFRAGEVVAMDAMLPAADLRRTEYFAGILRPVGVLHCFGACVFRRGDDVLSFTAVRPAAKGPFQPGELSHVRVILPHLQRAVQVSTCLKDLQRTRTALADALEHLAHGIVVIDGRGFPTFVNRAAREIAAARDGFAVTSDGIAASGRADSLRLRALVAQALRTGAGEGLDSGGAMTISRPSLKRPYLVVVAPLRLAVEDSPHAGFATLFISDPEAQTEPPAEIARRLFGLTTTESRVAGALAATGSMDAVADQLRIGRETARWHLKRIYRKTGTTRQAALVRLLREPSRLRLDARPNRLREAREVQRTT